MHVKRLREVDDLIHSPKALQLSTFILLFFAIISISSKHEVESFTSSVNTPERNENEVILQVILLKKLISIAGLKNSCVDSFIAILTP